MRKRREQRAAYLVAALLMCLVVVVALSWFVRQNSRNEHAQLLQQLSEVTAVKADAVNAMFDGLLNAMTVAADATSDQSELFSRPNVELLRKSTKTLNFDELLIADAGGRYVTTQGNYGSLISSAVYGKAIGEGRGVSPVFTDETDGHPFVVLYVPVEREGKKIGVLAGICRTENMYGIINMRTIEDSNDTLVFQPDGSLVIAAPSLNASNLQQISTSLTKTEMRDAITLAQKGQIGYLNYTLSGSGEARIACTMPLGINNWLVLCATSENAVKVYERLSNRAVVAIVTVVSLLYALLMVLMVTAHRKSKHIVESANQELRIHKERLDLTLSHLHFLLFDYDFPGDRMHFLNKGQMALADLPEEVSVDALFKQGVFHPDDAAAWTQLRQDLSTKPAADTTVELRVKTAAAPAWTWYRIHLKRVTDSKGRVIHIAGTMENIQRQHDNELLLRRRAEQDQLTELYNRCTCQQMIELYFSETEKPSAAFMLIDFDNFKHVNDVYGHQAGDQILKIMADRLRTVFRASDALGRLGGDEFLAFLKDIPDASAAMRKAEELCAAMHTIDVTFHTDRSCSVGVVYTNEPLDFDTLYQRADKALYRAKDKGKNCAVLYTDEAE